MASIFFSANEENPIDSSCRQSPTGPLCLHIFQACFIDPVGHSLSANFVVIALTRSISFVTGNFSVKLRKNIDSTDSQKTVVFHVAIVLYAVVMDVHAN